MRSPILPLALVMLLSALASAQLSLAPASLPDAAPGQIYFQELQASGGTAPYRWSMRGSLPSGLSFDTPTGTLTGTPAESGTYIFTVTLTDASGHAISRRYSFRVAADTTITIAWTRLPALANGSISGEVEVSNPTRETFDLTFVAVAVNEIGRATALGYQRFNFGPGKQKIPFGTTLPRGTYVVHADAVGEIARTRTVRRARLQSKPLVIP